MKKKIGMVSLGCPKNLVDSEIMLGLLKQSDYEITPDEKQADILIINTCGFIESAKQESINTILEMAEYKKHGCELLIVTGCLAERYKDTITKEIPEVDAVVGTGNYGSIAEVIKACFERENKDKAPDGEADGQNPYLSSPADIDYLESARVLSSKTGYAYVKIAEGCDNCCTYCIIPSLRGNYRSRRIENIENEVKSLAADGVKEIILVAQDTTRYGLDIYGEIKLVELLKVISLVDGIEWIRLLYCYPEEINDPLIEEMASNPKICKYLDIPIQHASDRILKLMGRRSSSGEIGKLLEKLKERIPGIILRTSLIVGFPGEDASDFEILQDFVMKNEFDRLGVFIYSKEEGTPAAKLRPQVEKRTKQARYNKIMKVQKEIMTLKSKQRLEGVYTTLVGGISDDGIFYYGRTYGEAPDIDGTVYFTSSYPLTIGSFVDVKILNTDDYDLIGDVINYEPAQ